MKENAVRDRRWRPIVDRNAAPVACLFQKHSDVFAKGYANLWQTSIERPTSIKRPLAGTPRVAA